MNSGPKWSLRHGSQYRRLCARPGCGASATATLRFQSTQRQAWLVELDENAARTQGDLCARHAAALVLPRGWVLHDERAPATWTPVANGADASKTAAVEVEEIIEAAAVEERVVEAPVVVAAPVEEPGVEEPGAEERVAEERDVEEPVAETETESEAEPATENGAAPRGVPAQFGASEDDDVDHVDEALGEILDARTPLLQRAFRNAKPE